MGLNRCHIAIIVAFAALLISLFGNLSLYQVAQENRETARNNKRVLCTFRRDLEIRYQNGLQFLEDHPDGIPGIPASALRVSLGNQKATLDSLKNLRCL